MNIEESSLHDTLKYNEQIHKLEALRLTREMMVELAQQTIAKNTETFVAQWVAQNPDKNIKDYEIVYKNSWDECTISIERK